MPLHSETLGDGTGEGERERERSSYKAENCRRAACPMQDIHDLASYGFKQKSDGGAQRERESGRPFMTLIHVDSCVGVCVPLSVCAFHVIAFAAVGPPNPQGEVDVTHDWQVMCQGIQGLPLCLPYEIGFGPGFRAYVTFPA